MRNLLQFLTRYSNFLIFLILEVVAFILICTHNEYQHSAVWSSANSMVAGVEGMKTQVVGYFGLRAENEKLAAENAQLKEQLMWLSNQAEEQLERDSSYLYSHLDWDYLPAKVVGITTNKQHNYLTINKGLRDSIEVALLGCLLLIICALLILDVVIRRGVVDSNRYLLARKHKECNESGKYQCYIAFHYIDLFRLKE